MPREFKIVSQAVNAAASDVYEFARQRDNLSKWASGLASAVRQEGEAWVAESPMGEIRIAMAPRNAFGVLDHDVTTPDGTTTHNAMRVTPADDGCVLAFVVLRAAGASDDAFAQDAAHVRKDLQALAALMEHGSPGA